MNDLISSSFKRYQQLDIEAGARSGTETIDLDNFFEDVEKVKEDMGAVETFYKRLQETNEETKTAHSAKTMKELRSKMDADVQQVLKRVKIIKGKLEALERSNAAHRKLPGCGPGSSADRTRTSVVSGLGKKLKVMMDDFQGLRARMAAEYKETVGRRYFTVTGERADEEMIENLISSGESESFQIFLDMAALVQAQGQQLNDIESHVAHASSFVRRGTNQLQEAREYQKSSRKCTCIAIILVIVVVIVLLFPVWWNLLFQNLHHR